jgi:hypothetical protein
MKLRRSVAILRRQIKWLTANAEKPAAWARRIRGNDRFRPLTEALVDSDL